jgi:hypothetical protein
MAGRTRMEQATEAWYEGQSVGKARRSAWAVGVFIIVVLAIIMLLMMIRPAISHAQCGWVPTAAPFGGAARVDWLLDDMDKKC